MSIVQLPDGRWRLDFRLSRNKRYRRHFSTKAAAENFRADIKASGGRKKQSLSQAIDNYLNWAEKIKRKAASTIRCDRGRLGIFLKWAQGREISKPDQIDFKAVDSFRSYFYENAPFDRDRIKKRYKPPNIESTWEHYRQNLSSFLAWCLKRRIVSENPARDPEFIPKPRKLIPPHFKPSELNRIFDYFDNRDKELAVPYFSIIFRTLAYTGMRAGELWRLEWRHIDFKRNQITIEISKNKTGRIVPIFSKLKPWLEKLPRDTRYIFGDSNGGHLYTQSWLLRQLEEATNMLGLERRRVHDLRHSFGASLARNRVSIAEIQKLMGHKLISSTLIYLAFSNDDLEKAVESLDI